MLRLNPLKREFTPSLSIVPFPVVSEVKIVGVIFSNTCFAAHVDSVIRKGNTFLQALSKMYRLGCDVKALITPTFAMCGQSWSMHILSGA